MDARVVLGQYRLLFRLNRHFWFANLFVGFAFPLLVQAVMATRVAPAGRTRLLIGNALLGLLMVTLRPSCFLPVFDRLTGRLDLLATTTLTRGGYLAALGLDALGMTLLPLAVLATGVAFLDVPAPASLAWAPVLVGTGLVLAAAGLWLSAFVHSLPSASLAANVVTMIFVAFCPLMYAMDRVPELLAPAVGLLPPTLCVEAVAAGWRGEPLGAWRVVGVVAWGVGLGIAAWRGFPWTEDRRPG